MDAYSFTFSFLHVSYRYYQGYNDDAAYTSHSHGWSSGPTSALTFYVAGLSITAPQGAEWSLAPHVNGPTNSVEAGFGTALGWFGVAWERGETEETVLSFNVTTPEGTAGAFTLPKGVSGTVKVNGTVVAQDAQEGQVVELQGGILQIVIS